MADLTAVDKSVLLQCSALTEASNRNVLQNSSELLLDKKRRRKNGAHEICSVIFVFLVLILGLGLYTSFEQVQTKEKKRRYIFWYTALCFFLEQIDQSRFN